MAHKRLKITGLGKRDKNSFPPKPQIVCKLTSCEVNQVYPDGHDRQQHVDVCVESLWTGAKF